MERLALRAHSQMLPLDSLCQLFLLCPPHEPKTWGNAVNEFHREYTPKEDTPCISGMLNRCGDKKVSHEDSAIKDLNKKPATRSPEDEKRDSNPWKNP